MYDIRNIFPKINGVDRNMIKYTSESEYSVSAYKHAKWLSDLIIKKYEKKYKLIDMTANVGGNTISFLLSGLNVKAYEIDKITFDYLKNNVNLYINNASNKQGINLCGKIELINERSENMIPKENERIIFIDPPWGGPDYKTKKSLMLYLGKTPLYTIVDNLISKDCYIYLKLPLNFDFKKFNKKIETKFVSTTYEMKNNSNKPLYYITEIIKDNQ